MLNTIFYFILNMSINACVIILLILIIRTNNAIPKTFVYGFWLVAFIRLILPFTISSSLSLFNYTGGLIKRVISVETIITGFEKIPFDMTATNALGTAAGYFPVIYKANGFHDVFVVSSYVWLTGVLLSLTITIILYIFTSLEFRKATQVENDIYFSEKLVSPLLVGIFKPKIVLPSTFDINSASAQYVIAHEKFHKKRLDNLWRVLAIVIVCFHWFNPMAWILLKYFFIDMELSCDEKVIKKYGIAKRKEYAKTLVSFADYYKFSISSAFGKTTVKARVLNVINFKRMTAVGCITAITFLIALAIAFITNPSV